MSAPDALARSPLPDCTPTGRYRIIDLGALPATGTTESVARGLNEHAVVVGWSGPDDGQPTPFVWMPRDGIYPDLDAWTLYDLTALDGAPSFVFGRAEDINDDGIAVGWREYAGSPTIQRAFVWNLGADPVEYFTLGVYCPVDPACEFEEDCGTASRAFAANDDDPALIVGWAAGACGCASPGPTPKNQLLGFAWVLGDDEDELKRLNPVDADEAHEEGLAFDVSDTSGMTPAAAVGASKTCGSFSPCGPQLDGLRWPALDTASPTPETVEEVYGEVEVWSINDCGWMAGWGRRDTEGEHECEKRAVVWNEERQIEVNLHDDAVPAVDEEDDTIANAINELDDNGRVQVVGANESDTVALLWERDDSGDWTRLTLHDALGPCGTYGWSNLRDATDINNKGQICGFGIRNGDVRAFLLVCIADLDLDGFVNATDTGLVLASWGSCADCLADFDESGTVDSEDLGYALTAWSGAAPCGRPDHVAPDPPCPSSEQESMSGPAEVGMTVSAALALLSFASIDAFAAWASEASLEQIQAVLAFVYAMVGGAS